MRNPAVDVRYPSFCRILIASREVRMNWAKAPTLI